MALQVHSIGGYVFRTMRGEIDMPQRDMQVIERPGLDEFELRKLGIHSKPFSVVASRDVRTILEGRQFLANYAGLVGANPVAMIWANYPFTAEGRNVAVLRVEQLELKAAFPICNPFFADSLYVLRVAWSLMLV